MTDIIVQQIRRVTTLAVAAVAVALVMAFGAGWGSSSVDDLTTRSAPTHASNGGHGNGTENPPPDDPPCDADGGHEDNPGCTGKGRGDHGQSGGDHGKSHGNHGKSGEDHGNAGGDHGNGSGDDGTGDDGTDQSCADDVDNDNDGAIDADDTECADSGDGVEDGSDGSDEGTGTGSSTCAKGGLTGDATIAEQLAGPVNEIGPISGQLHSQAEPQAQQLTPVVHEVSCVIGIVDSNAPQ